MLGRVLFYTDESIHNTPVLIQHNNNSGQVLRECLLLFCIKKKDKMNFMDGDSTMAYSRPVFCIISTQTLCGVIDSYNPSVTVLEQFLL